MNMQKMCLFFMSIISLFPCAMGLYADGKQPDEMPSMLSEQTQVCLMCHKMVTPGIVEDWLTSRHSKITPAMSFAKPIQERRLSSDTIPDTMKPFVVGCFECHGQNPSLHQDNFNHFGFKINVVVSPNDCKTCHAVEVEEYSGSKKANALVNIQKNPLYHTFVDALTGLKTLKDNEIMYCKASDTAKAETCYACHGTEVTVKGLKKISTNFGEIEVPDLTNWPNQGVGRINPDGSHGACTSCHPRHGFSIEIARKPYTCSQCHLEPDVPSFEVYSESKHGNIFCSTEHLWNWSNVPWIIGKDFKAPTCATCHNSLIATSDGKTIVPRTHDFGARLWVRLFGLIYSHPQPKSGKTYEMINSENMPLPTSFTGEPASEYLIDEKEQLQRQIEMKKVCQGCHGTNWSNAFFSKLEAVIDETDAMVQEATKLVQKAWDEDLADPANPFDEMIEHLWIKQWFFYANSIRYAAAMSGPDYATFKNGWMQSILNLHEMLDMTKEKE
ncbi:MAG: hydroxylamine oxidase [Candidatus Brocadiaceae bacterium]|nr:hydroxylamine oxidase [Candidatus Brocadiaceae bacterium]